MRHPRAAATVGAMAQTASGGGAPRALAVITSADPDEATAARARERASEWGLDFLQRPHRRALRPMIGRDAEALIVFEKKAVALWDRAGALHFHPGVAHLRLGRLEAGVLEDTFLRVAELREGEAVLDCTLGLAQDALVAARAVGPKGRVVGLEKSLALFAVLSEGLALHDPGPRSCRIEAVRADYLEFLKAQQSGSFDCVVFDPMFEKPRKAQAAFEVVRRHAEYAPLTPEALGEARRVARRRVLVKGPRYGPEFRRLGLTPTLLSRFSEVAWAIVEPMGTG